MEGFTDRNVVNDVTSNSLPSHQCGIREVDKTRKGSQGRRIASCGRMARKKLSIVKSNQEMLFDHGVIIADLSRLLCIDLTDYYQIVVNMARLLMFFFFSCVIISVSFYISTL